MKPVTKRVSPILKFSIAEKLSNVFDNTFKRKSIAEDINKFF